MSDTLSEHLDGQGTLATSTPFEPAKPNARNRPDWVNVRLTAAAQAVLGASPSVHVSNGFMQYRFDGATTVSVLKAGEWTKILATETIAAADGTAHPMFEIVADATA